jgi:pyruvyltransferase
MINIFYFKGKNFGDSVSKLFWAKIINSKFDSSMITTDTSKIHYITIGSVMHFLNKNSIVFGTGFISAHEHNMPSKPLDIIAVRGPLTRERIIKLGMSCPENYGDPLILMPCIYNIKKIINDNIVGIIPHYVDKNNSNLNKLKHNLEESGYVVKIIDIEVGENYTQLIDEINDCKYILSSSLHGVIMGIVYHKKTCFIEFSNKVIGGAFKFQDFFGSLDIKYAAKSLYNSDILENYINVDYDKLIHLGNKLISLIPFIDNSRKSELIEIYTKFYIS